MSSKYHLNPFSYTAVLIDTAHFWWILWSSPTVHHRQDPLLSLYSCKGWQYTAVTVIERHWTQGPGICQFITLNTTLWNWSHIFHCYFAFSSLTHSFSLSQLILSLNSLSWNLCRFEYFRGNTVFRGINVTIQTAIHSWFNVNHEISAFPSLWISWFKSF